MRAQDIQPGEDYAVDVYGGNSYMPAQRERFTVVKVEKFPRRISGRGRSGTTHTTEQWMVLCTGRSCPSPHKAVNPDEPAPLGDGWYLPRKVVCLWSEHEAQVAAARARRQEWLDSDAIRVGDQVLCARSDLRPADRGRVVGHDAQGWWVQLEPRLFPEEDVTLVKEARGEIGIARD